MTSVEKRRSSRKGGGHRKHSDGGYSDTSSGGSFLDETDREVSNLTDRAFRSLCIGDEAVYNDSDLGSSSPCVQRDRQLAFSQSSQDRYREDREELKRAAHESFSARVQQYGQDWSHGGRYGAEIQRDPQWEVYGDRTQGRISATFQHNVVETSQQERSLRDDQLSLFSNGATDSQQRRSRSRVSSLIRAFNSDTNRDGGMDEKLREWNNESSWEKSALMNMQRELSEFSSSYQQNFNSEYFPPSGPFSSSDTGFYSSEVAAVAHMNSASAFTSASHSMSTQVNCNSNFFIHSEFSPFRVWRNHNRFPFQHGEVSGFMHSAEFPKWYETPMYRELSQEAQPQRPYGFQERSLIHQRNNMVPMVPPTPPRSTSTSMMQQKAYAVEKRCESELAGNYPHRKRTQSLGTNRLPSQRPSTASPTVEMSRRVRDTISSVKALQQKIKMMAEQNMETEMTAYQPAAPHSRDNLIPFGNSAMTAAPNVVRGNRTPLNISQMLTPSLQAYQEAGTSLARQGADSPQLVEHAPVRAESRGATPDIRTSTYKSRATSLLFNIKDNRKRVKNKYSPTKFKQPEPRDTVIDIPDYPDPDVHFSQAEVFNRTSATHQYGNQYQNPAILNSHPQTVHAGQYSQYTSSDYRAAQMQGDMAHHSRFTGFTPENYATNQLANGQNPHQDLSPFTPYKQGIIDNAELQGGDVHGFRPSYRAAETARNTGNNQHFISQANAEQYFNETERREGCQQPIDNQHNYSNVSSQDRWKQTNSQNTERHRVAVSPWKQEITTLMEKDQHALTYPGAAQLKGELTSNRDKQNVNAEFESREFMGIGGGLVNPGSTDHVPQYTPDTGNYKANYQGHYGQSNAMRDKYVHQNRKGHDEGKESRDNYLTQNYDRSTDPEYKHPYMSKNKQMQETSQTKQYTEVSSGHESVQPEHTPSQYEPKVQKNPLSSPDSAGKSTVVNQVKDGQLAGVKAGQAAAEHAQKELAKSQQQAQVEQPTAESVELILATPSGSEKVKAEWEAKAEPTEHERMKPDKSKERREEIHPGHSTTQQMKPKATEEARDMTKETGLNHMKVEQCAQVKADQAEAGELKEANIKTDLEKNLQTNIHQTVQTRGEEDRQVKAEQNERELQETEQIQTETVKAEQVETEQGKVQQVKHAPQAQTEQKKMKVREMEAVKDFVKVKDGENKKDSIQAIVNLEKTETQLSKAKEAKVGEQIKLERPKTEDLHERFSKPGSKQTAIIQVKGEPNKVEQVKTELARAKAELAKINEKMKGQKDEVKLNLMLMEDDSTKKDFPLNANIVTVEVQKKDHAAQIHKQPHKSFLSKYGRDNIDRGGESYTSLREKYGFTYTLSTNRSTDLTETPDEKEKPTLSLDTTETVDNKKQNPTNGHATTNTTNKEELGSYKSSEETDGHYVYSESSKEFKLSGSKPPAQVGDGTSSDSVEGKVRNDSAEKLENFEAVKHTRVPDTTKLHPLDKKPKSFEQSAGSLKNLHVTPPRTLTHKERAQTKQDLLTSKIKAHAEKEISAIKEKGFTLRDLSKNTTKQLVGSQSLNIRQRPPSQEASKKHESTPVSNTTPKHQMEQSGIQMETVKSVSTPSSATIPVLSAARMGQTKELPQIQSSKDPVKSNVCEPNRDAKETRCEDIITSTGWVEKQNTESQSVVKSSIRSNELAPEENHRNQETRHETKQRNGLKDNSAIITDRLSTKNKDLSQAASVAKSEGSKPTTSAKAESKAEEVQTDSAPSINLVCRDQKKPPLADDDLQIMGIMVIVRERRPSESSDQKDNSSQVHVTTKEKEPSDLELDNIQHSSGRDVSKAKYLPKENKTSNKKDRVAQDMQEESNRNLITCRPENMQATIKENVSESINEKGTQKRNSVHPKSHRETQEPLAEKVVPSVTAPAKNKVLAETQHLHKQDIKDREKKDCSHIIPKDNLANVTRTDEENIKHTNQQKPQLAPTKDNLQAKVVNKGITQSNDLNKAVIKHDFQQTEAKTTVVNPPSIKDTGGKSGPLMERKTNNSLQQINTTTSSQDLNEKKNSHVSPNVENKEANTGQKLDTDVHIGGIAVRVVPRCSEPAKDDSLSLGAKVNTSSNKDRIRELSPEDELKVQHVLSSVRKLSDSLRNSIQHNNNTTTSENTENQRADCSQESREPVDESKVQGLMGEYFQVQGSEDTNNDVHTSANVGQTLRSASHEKQPPTSQTKNNTVCEEVKHDAFVFTQSMIKTVESNKSSFDNENVETKPPTSKQSEVSTERQESNHFRKYHTVNQSTISTRERPNLKNTHSTRESSVKEKHEVKPKPKERISTIPEISALADYARLKVIVSEERENTLQEFPHNKKEGFFPLIQSHHSRRPVFTDDPKGVSVKEKHLPNKKETSSKVSGEPKALVFPITESKHQRTGMFKLGDIDKHEKKVFDKSGKSDVGVKPASPVKEGHKSPISHLKKKSEERVTGSDNQTLNIPLPNTLSLEAISSSSAVSEPKPTSAPQQLKSPVNTDPHEHHERLFSTLERETFSDKDYKLENKPTKTREQREHCMTQQGGDANHCEDTTAKVSQEASMTEEEKKTEEMRIKRILEESRASLVEEERRAAQREEERRAREREAIALRIKERREKQREADKREEEERKGKQTKENKDPPKEEGIVWEEGKREGQIERTQSLDKRRAKLRGEADHLQEREERRLKHQEEEKTSHDEQQKRAAEEEEQRRVGLLEEQQRRANEEEQQQRAVQEEQQRKAAIEEQQRGAAIEEQQRNALIEEQQRKALIEEQQRKAAAVEMQRNAELEEKQKKAAIEEQQRRTAAEEQQKRAAAEEQQRKAAIEERQRKAVIEEQQKRAIAEEELRRAAAEEQQSIAAAEEQQRRSAAEEQQRRAAIREEQRKAAAEEQQRKALIEYQQRMAAIEEEQRKAALIEEQLKKAAEEEQARTQEEEKQQKAVQEEQQRRAALEEQQRRAALEEHQQRVALIEEQRQAKHTEEKQEPLEKQAEEERTRKLERQGEEEKEQAAGRDYVIRAKNREDEKLAAKREKEKAVQMEEQRRAAQMTDALQYYAISSAEPEKKAKERHLRSPLPHHQKTYSSVREPAEDPGYHSRLYRSQGSASPALSLPRSNTSSPALGAKPSMFKVKDNTMRGSPFTKSVKPRFHKNFGEEFRVGSPMERVPARGEEMHEIMRHSTTQPESSKHPVVQDYSAHLPQHRPYSRRSIALDEDDSRSVMSNMSEDVESFATSAADLADLRGLYDHDRPESACSFSSDVSRSMGRPPVVPPKSEKALRRAKRLTTRRIKKDLCKSAEEIPALQEISGVHPPEVQSSKRYAVASPHISPPVSLAHAPELMSGLPSSHTEHPSSHHSVRASPHATGPISLPVTLPRAVAVPLPTAPHPANVPASHPAALKTVSHVSSSPSLHHANHPAPVTQYHVESSYPQSYPLTQRKVLQDLGSGQYYVVDVPVPVKTKTFFDPETGKYVQLNVRESSKSTSLTHPQHTYPQPQLQNQMVIKSQQEPISRSSPTGKPLVLYQGHQGYPPSYQPAAVNSVPPHRSSGPTSHLHNPQDVGEIQSHGHPAPSMRQTTEGSQCYSPEKTPYMDTVNDTEKRQHTVYDTHGSYEVLPECDTNSQLGGNSICENEISAPSSCQPRDIITIGELEDFMDMSDW